MKFVEEKYKICVITYSGHIFKSGNNVRYSYKWQWKGLLGLLSADLNWSRSLCSRGFKLSEKDFLLTAQQARARVNFWIKNVIFVTEMALKVKSLGYLFAFFLVNVIFIMLSC